MNPATEKERNLAWRLLRQVAGSEQSPEGLVEATERVFDRLYRHLGAVVGPAGYAALVARALHLTTRQFAFMGNVRGEARADDFVMDGLRASVLGRDPAEARPSQVTLLANLIALLVTFVGEDLALRLIGQAWPETTGKIPGFEAEERHP